MPLALSGQRPIGLGRPEAEFKEPFTQIASVRELSDGRVLITDPRDRIVLLIDFKSNTATKVGREGSGPGEYVLPQRIVALPGDTSAIYDPSNQRYVTIAPDGKTGSNFSLEEAIGGGRGRPGGTAPKGTDSRGRIFYEGSPFVSAGGGVAPADSAPVMRYDRGTKRSDTVAYVNLAKGNAQVSGLDGNVRMLVGRAPFPARDEWAALADGGVAIVRVHDYHVDRYSAAGKRTSGAPVRMDVIAVTEADKEAWRAERRGIANAGLQQGRGGAPPSSRPPTRPIPEPEFPAFKPPFVQGNVFARPNREVWVLRSRKAGDNVPVYDVFSSTGMMSARVAFPPNTRLVGFGNGTVYVARNDEDDLQYLQRYRFSAMPNSPGQH